MSHLYSLLPWYISDEIFFSPIRPALYETSIEDVSMYYKYSNLKLKGCVWAVRSHNVFTDGVVGPMLFIRPLVI